ncbi:MAG: thioredoxin domain-containing protein [Candidatus Omnitrophica bacterium]|nr:thioredoxin domain-containing protein [Candidatus Omnitrophota bacterium]MBU1996900.1 thioredoxin domain-containing protein [Candidatus Omnitrophota bacterium]MBU4334189.1 thioredoxin domain-containing protein [Candidatus Omnitrophota bacterium]
MSKKNIAVLSIIAFFIIGSVISVKYYFKEKPVEIRVGSLARVRGNDAAPIKIVEFMDFRCYPCALGSKYLKTLIKENPDSIRLEMKYFPLSINQDFAISARYAECASRQGKFWQYHDLLIEEQEKWKKYMNPQTVFESYAKQIKLDTKQLDACLQDKTVFRKILDLKEEGQALGVTSTPTYFINGKKIVGLKLLKEEISSLLKVHSAQ